MNSRFADRLVVVLQVAAIVFSAVCVFRIAVHRGVVVAPTHAEASLTAADHKGGSR